MGVKEWSQYEKYGCVKCRKFYTFVTNNILLNMKKIFTYIQSHFLLRNLLLAVSLIIVSIYIISVLLNLFTRHNQKNEVPNLYGMTMEEAKKASKKAGLELVVVDSLYVPKGVPGTVLDQNPKATTNVKSGRKIFLTINSLRPKMAEIPYVVGLTLRQAKNRLESKGFEIEQLVYVSDMATNNVRGQSFKGKEISNRDKLQAELGSAVTLSVGKNPGSPVPVVPKVIGMTLHEAKSALWAIGFNIGDIKYDSGITPDDYDKARVYKQLPSQESRNSYGSKVGMWLTLDKKFLEKSSREADELSRQELEAQEEEEDSVINDGEELLSVD